MKQTNFFLLSVSAFLLCHTVAKAQAQPAITLRLDQPGHSVSPKLYGLMTEEINYSYEGGLYGELIRNRVFKDNPMAPDHWTAVQEGGAKGKITIDRQNRIND